LVNGIERALPGWVRRSVEGLVTKWSGAVSDDVSAATARAGEDARDWAVLELRALLERDIDEQRQTPLAIVRAAVRFPTAVLRQAGVPPVQRDPFAARAFPSDIYDLSPASFADVDPDLADVAIAWGASKAMAHRRRHGGSR